MLKDGKRIVVEHNVEMKTRDGVTLRADIYRPDDEGRYPVVLERTPYDKRGEGFGPQVATHGYVFIAQDVRGRYASDGEWYPLKYEANDGYDAVEWAAALPYANGKVGMYGPSYLSLCQLLAACAAPPHLSCIMPYAMGSNAHEQFVYVGGAFSQALDQGWTSAVSLDYLQKIAGRSAQPSHWDMKLPLEVYPVLEPTAPVELAPYYFDWLKHPDYDAFWKAWSIEEHFGQIRVPALHVGAWYDYFQEGSIRNYLGMKAHGATEQARGNQRLVMIVGGHAGAGPTVGDLDYGKDSVLDIGGLALRWYDWVMKGIDNGMAREKPVRLFLMGKNQWIEASDWPYPGAIPTRFYFDCPGSANSSAGSGLLAAAPAKAEREDVYTYDPASPVPTVGGPAFGDASLKPGPRDQSEVEKRSDVLVYSGTALTEPTTVIGSVLLDLYVQSGAVDTDFTGKLVDVYPDGRAFDICEGILRMRYRDGREHPVPMLPGTTYRVAVELGSTAHVFLPGHRIRVEVSSSNFPRFDRNLNTGAAAASTAEKALPTTNRILHGPAHPSALVLAVAPSLP